MSIDPAQRAFRWFESEHRTAVARELAVREAVSRSLPLVEQAIEQAEHRIVEQLTETLDADRLYRRVTKLEDRLAAVMRALRSSEDPALTNLDPDRPVSPHELGHVEALLEGFLQQAFDEVHDVRSQVRDMQAKFGSIQDGHEHLGRGLRAHIEQHSQGEDAADWWKRGEEPFGDENGD
jgi:hypothetical protein